ncbi:uncharacterized protein LOC119349526 [Triticum dicoccoides]|uniref:uncharacterized protein LOC119349526 n=1 Tax=Triticum dicoccoides TaxID=85692 RepID=UPI0018902986|nr:uncharacterized protein LOC119349526 [Triticum dicoccoides]
MAAGGTADGGARCYSHNDRSYIRWRVELQPQRHGAATMAATRSYDADDAGAGQFFCWNGRQEVLQPWQQNVGTNSHDLQQMRNRLFKKLQPCTGKLQPHARELQAVYTGATTGGARRR